MRSFIRTTQLLTTLLLILTPGYAQAKKWQEFKYDEFALGTGLNIPSLELALLDNHEDKLAKKIKYIPNQAGNLFLAVQYGNLGFSLGRKGELSRDKQEINVHSDFTDYQFRFLGSRHTFNFFYQKYTGYYIENYSEYDSTINVNSPNVLYPNLSTVHSSISYFYNFNPDNYSLDAAFGIGDQQIASGGAWLLALAYNHHTIDNPIAILPSFAPAGFASISGFTGGSSSSYSVGGGGAYTYVKNRFYASALLLLSYLHQDQKYNYGSVTEEHNKGSGKVYSGLALGYNANSHKGALQLQGETTSSLIRSAKMNFSTISVNLYYAYRFGSVNIPVAKDVSEWIDKF